MKISFFTPALILGLFIITTSCTHYQNISDDDVYVVKAPAISSEEEINDETSYSNYKYNRDRNVYSSQYGFSNNVNWMMFYYYPYQPFPRSMMGNPRMNWWFEPNYYNTYGYGNYYWSYDPFYYNYWYDPNPYFYGNCSPVIVHSQNETGNKIYKARNTIGGINSPRRVENNGQGFVGMATKNIKNPYSSIYASRSYNKENSVSSRKVDVVTNSRSSRPVEKGVGLSKDNVRVGSTNLGATRISSSNSNYNNLNSKGISRSNSFDSNKTIERSNNSGTRGNSTPRSSSGRRMN